MTISFGACLSQSITCRTHVIEQILKAENKSEELIKFNELQKKLQFIADDPGTAGATLRYELYPGDSYEGSIILTKESTKDKLKLVSCSEKLPSKNAADRFKTQDSVFIECLRRLTPDNVVQGCKQLIGQVKEPVTLFDKIF